MSQKKAKGRGTMSRRVARIEAERRRAVRRRRMVRAAQIGLPVLVIGLGLVVFLLIRSGPSKAAKAAVTDITKSTDPSATTTTAPPVPPTVKSCEEASGSVSGKPQFPTGPVMMIDPAKTYLATMETNKGTFAAQLSPTAAPQTVNSFVFLARCGFYDNTIIHRVAKGFVIQGGDPTGTGGGGPGYVLPDELPPKPGYALGDLAMANAGPGTSGSQWFIVTGENGGGLQNSYSLFGRVTSGLEVAQAIEQLPSDPDQDGKPKEEVRVTKVTIEER